MSFSVKEITNYTEANAASEIEYSQENVFGSEEVVNGDFDTDSDWTLFSGCTISNGAVNCVSSTSIIQQTLNTVVGNTYECTLSYTKAIGIRLRVENGSNYYDSVNMEESGVLKILFVAGSQFRLAAGGSAFTGSIDNVSVKEITNAVTYQNIAQDVRDTYTLIDDTWVGSNELVVNGDFSDGATGWSLGTGWALVESKMTKVSGVNSTLAMTSVTNALTVGGSYEVSFSIEHTAGILDRVYITGSSSQFLGITASGDYSYVLIADGTNLSARVVSGSSFEGSIDNISIKEVIEVADFIEPVTQGMTLTEAWTTRGAAYTTLRDATSASVRVDATISNADNGVLMEMGGSTYGLILYVYNSVLYFQCGSGNGYGTVSDRAEVSYTLPVGESDYIIEWSADTSNAVLYVNGLVVGSQAFSEIFVAGTNFGTVGEVESAAAVNRGGWTTDGAGVYTNTITKCDIFNNQITSDV